MEELTSLPPHEVTICGKAGIRNMTLNSEVWLLPCCLCSLCFRVFLTPWTGRNEVMCLISLLPIFCFPWLRIATTESMHFRTNKDCLHGSPGDQFCEIFPITVYKQWWLSVSMPHLLFQQACDLVLLALEQHLAWQISLIWYEVWGRDFTEWAGSWHRFTSLSF